MLASSSPRRRELLARVGLVGEVVAADIDESVLGGEMAGDYVRRMAGTKAATVADRRPETVILAADTTVVLDGEILAKPIDDDDARGMLARLSGRTHEVLTAVSAVDRTGSMTTRVVAAGVTFATLTSAEIDWYVLTGEPVDKAGAYALQGQGAVLVERIEGDPTTVIGLPLRAAVSMLASAGVRAPGVAGPPS